MRKKQALLILNIIWWLLGGIIILCIAVINPGLFYIFNATNKLLASGLMRLYSVIVVPIMIYAGIMYLRAHIAKSPHLFDSARKYISLSLIISLIATLGSLLIFASFAVFAILFSALGFFAAMLPVVCVSAIGALWSFIGIMLEKKLRRI